jgi:hypothetical protein
MASDSSNDKTRAAQDEAVTRQQADTLMWAELKPMVWSGIAIACAVGTVMAMGAFSAMAASPWLAVASAAVGAFALYKEWQSENELALTAHRIGERIGSSELASALKEMDSPAPQHQPMQQPQQQVASEPSYAHPHHRSDNQTWLKTMGYHDANTPQPSSFVAKTENVAATPTGKENTR